MGFDPLAFKSQFPLFIQPENQSLVYLDNASTTQKPQAVIDAITHCYLHSNGNAQRASHRLARSATHIIEYTRALACEFLGAKNSCEVVFTSGATTGLNMIAYGLQDYCRQGDEILLSDGEHHANLLPWQRLAKNTQSTLRFFSLEQGIEPSLETKITPKTRVLTFTAASNVLGNINDLSLIAKIKKQYPSLIVIIDASQIAAHIPLNVNQWQCDFLVCSAHKFYGPTGIGLLYLKEQWLKKLSPLLLGGEMVGQVEKNSSEFVEAVERFEAGTSSLSAIAGLQGCLQFWQLQDRVAMRQYEEQLTIYLYQQLSRLCKQYSDLRLVSQPNNNVGIATMVSQNNNMSMSDMAHWLDEQDIAVRVGDHCAQTLWQSIGNQKGLRISLAAYNTLQDVDTVVNAMQDFCLHQNDWIDQKQDGLSLTIDDLSTLTVDDLIRVKSWQKKFKLLQQWGACISTKPILRQAHYLVKGCETDVWFLFGLKNEKYYFYFDSDSAVIKGLAALLLVLFNGKTRDEIQSIDVESTYQELGLSKHLSLSRMNGFKSLLDSVLASVLE